LDSIYRYRFSKVKSQFVGGYDFSTTGTGNVVVTTLGSRARTGSFSDVEGYRPNRAFGVIPQFRIFDWELLNNPNEITGFMPNLKSVMDKNGPIIYDTSRR